MRLEDHATGELWERARAALEQVNLREESKLDSVLTEVQDRVGRFMGLDNDGVHLHASDLTRESIRETLRVFITASPGHHPVPFNRLSTGSLNLLVFALLTYIAELKGDHAVIFAMEEPEIALPPHAQRRLVDFVTKRMGQAIVTSHSPYVIERFAPESILLLKRTDDGVLSSDQFDLGGLMKPKKVREERRQFAEAILGRGVLVVEGATEASVIPVVADVMDADPSLNYTHLDLLGVSVYDAKSDAGVPPLGPVFKTLGKRCYGLHDSPKGPFSADAPEQIKSFDKYLQIPHTSIEKLLLAEMPMRPKRAFLTRAAALPDYPHECGQIAASDNDITVEALLEKVLLARKGAYYGYAALLVAEAASVGELPKTYVDFLRDIEADIVATTGGEPSPATSEGGDDETETGDAAAPAPEEHPAVDDSGEQAPEVDSAK